MKNRSIPAAVFFALFFGCFSFAETIVTRSSGTISEFSPDALVIRAAAETAPTRYLVSRDITYVDETGAPVSVELVKSGLPVTVEYVRDGERVIATRLVVRRNSAPVAKTVIVEQERRPAVEREAVVVEKREPVVVERAAPVVVEKRVTPTVIEKSTTTTTTTETVR